jgi:hypothetical protein
MNATQRQAEDEDTFWQKLVLPPDPADARTARLLRWKKFWPW